MKATLELPFFIRILFEKIEDPLSSALNIIYLCELKLVADSWFAFNFKFENSIKRKRIKTIEVRDLL